MGIMNVTPDSFYAGSRAQTEDSIRARILEIVSEGGDIIDLGAYSTRPGADEISEEEEKARLEKALRILSNEYPQLIYSVDTWRSNIARWAVEEFAKTLEQNYTLMNYIPRFIEATGLPLLVGISRKSMIYKLLGIDSNESLNGTSILNTHALLSGAKILRVHDVRAAVEAVKLTEELKKNSLPSENPIFHIEATRN